MSLIGWILLGLGAVALLFHRHTVRGWWQALESVGVKEPRGRWRRQPRQVQKGVPPFAIAIAALLIGWATWVQPDPSLVVLLAIVFAFYLASPNVRRFALPLAVLGLAISYPYYGPPSANKMFEIPLLETFPNMNTMVVMAIFTMMAIGLNMVVGYAGLLDLGYVAFYAIGAYTAAWFASPQFSGGANPDGSAKERFVLGAIDVPSAELGGGGVHISMWLVLLMAAVLTAFAGVVIGLPTLRLRGDYLAIVTLGFGEILPQVARNGDNIFGFNVTSGPQGITPIDAPGFGHTIANALGVESIANFVTAGNSINLFYWTAIALVLITIFCSIRLRDSRLGRAWIAIREDETAAAAMGVPLMRTKTWAYASGAFFGGIAGAWFAASKTGVFPDDFFFNISVFILCMVILGGMGNVWGVIAGACFLTYLDREGLANIGGWWNKTDFGVFQCNPEAQSQSLPISAGCLNAPLLSFGIYGLIIVIVMLVRPQGIWPEARRKRELEEGVHDEPLMDVIK